jgi:hypothetical protein
VLLALAACEPSDDVVGPFTGEVTRFVVDRIAVPTDTDESLLFSADLDGDGESENQIGLVTALLSSTDDLSIHAPDMIASGAIASSLTIQADNLDDDLTAGVMFYGHDDASAIEAGGRFGAGSFRSNRTRDTEHPGAAQLRLPVFTNADPLVLDLVGMEIDLVPDGLGGYDAVIRGGIREAHARDVAFIGLVQMLETEPERHLVFARGLDRNRDGMITREEVDESVINLLVAADIQLFVNGRYSPKPASGTPDCLSIAFGVHLTPCEEGPCLGAPVQNRCRDRIQDGDETDIDCGGSCQPCATLKRCLMSRDCQSRRCDTGACRAPTCTDNVLDGLESDVDCGGPCDPCPDDSVCVDAGDCMSGKCDAELGDTGFCIP